MAALAFAVLSAFGFGWTNVFMHLGLKGARVSSFTALLINLVGGTITLAVVIPLLNAFPESGWNWTGILYFAASGLVAALLGQAANFAAIDCIGATRTACFVMADNVFAAVLAFVVLGQTVSLLSGFGILVLMAGAAAFVWETAGNRNGPISPDATGVRRASFGISMALVSALCFSTAGVLRGLGVAALPAALVGSAINNLSALVVMVIAYLVTGRIREPFAVGRRQGVFLLLSGAAAAVGTAGFILALQYGGSVAISTALKNLAPLFTFALALWLLHRHERLSLRLGLLVCTVVFGGVLTALGKG